MLSFIMVIKEAIESWLHGNITTFNWDKILMVYSKLYGVNAGI